MTFGAFWKWLNDNGGALGAIAGILAIIVALLPIIWATVQYITIKKADERRLQFTTFHELIKQLVQPEAADQAMRIDRQVAVIFELRSFKRYFPVTLRILQGLKKDWAGMGAVAPGERLLKEIDLAIADIKKKV